jgi:hypothetical protein
MENYKVIKDFPDYAINREGEVISLRFNRKLKPYKDRKGYICLGIGTGTSRKHLKIHRLVAEAYIDNINNHPQVNHINCNKTDNRVENLEWCTPSQNIKHAFINKLRISAFGEKHANSKLTELKVLEIRNSSLSKKELSTLYNVSYNTIRIIINRNAWKHI